MDTEQSLSVRSVTAIRVQKAFLVFSPEGFFDELKSYTIGDGPYVSAIVDAIEGFRRTIAAASLPFQLIQDAVIQQKFDRLHSAERIRALKQVNAGSGLTLELQESAYRTANEKMSEFLTSSAGNIFMRDRIVDEMDQRLKSKDVENAASELCVQTLISTWSIFESFSRTFLVSWMNEHPDSASRVLSSPELKEFFGKNPIDIKSIERHSFDLSKSMGTIIFLNRRLDSLNVIRGIAKALFNSSDVQIALGDDLWLLNQRRNIFVHRRGIVDQDYLNKTGEKIPLDERLPLTCDDIEHYFYVVRAALTALCEVASKTHGVRVC